MKKSAKVLHELFSQRCPWGDPQKVLTYIEYRAVSGVFRTIYPPPPLHPTSVSSPRTKGRGVHTCRAVRGWGGVNISEDALHWMASYSIIPLRGPQTVLHVWFPPFLEAGLAENWAADAPTYKLYSQKLGG